VTVLRNSEAQHLYHCTFDLFVQLSSKSGQWIRHDTGLCYNGSGWR